MVDSGFYPPNPESESGANFPPITFGLKSPLFGLLFTLSHHICPFSFPLFSLFFFPVLSLSPSSIIWYRLHGSDVNRHTARYTGPVYPWSRSVKTAVWQRAKETKISAARWALRLGKDFTFTFFLLTSIIKYCSKNFTV